MFLAKSNARSQKFLGISKYPSFVNAFFTITLSKRESTHRKGECRKRKTTEISKMREDERENERREGERRRKEKVTKKKGLRKTKSREGKREPKREARGALDRPPRTPDQVRETRTTQKNKP